MIEIILDDRVAEGRKLLLDNVTGAVEHDTCENVVCVPDNHPTIEQVASLLDTAGIAWQWSD